MSSFNWKKQICFFIRFYYYFLSMETAIPIIVTRLNEQQIKQIFTHRDSLKPPHKFSSQPESKRDGFNTIDQS